MLDTDQRQALMTKLRDASKKASSNISTKIEACKGDFKVVITADSIDHFYKNVNVGNLKVSSLDDDMVDLINSDANDAAHEMLESFASNFDVSTTQITPNEKTAAHETQNEQTYQMVTQKQLDDQKPNLHPRTDDYPNNVTQKQIPENGQRPGTFEEITEAQFSKEKSTFYNEPLEAGARVSEDRNIITEGQFDDGVKEYSDKGQSERGETSSKFDGDLAKQQKMIGEKQLAELLKHHEWTEPLTTTEGKEQLSQQDGELGRLTAETAQQIIKEALNALGNTVLAAGVTPAELSAIVKKLVSHPSKHPVLANVIKEFSNHDIKSIQEKVAKAQYFGKVANVGNNWSNEVIADCFVRQLSKISHSPQHIVDGLIALANDDNFENRINENTDSILSNEKQEAVTEANTNVFNQVLSGEHAKPVVEGSADDDGLYEYTGKINEVKADVNDRDKFAVAAADLAKSIIKVSANKTDLTLNPLSIDVAPELGTFKIQLKDASFEEETLEVRAEKRREIVKEAQMGGGGGAPPAAGDQMGNPMAPPGGADMGAGAPGEAFSQDPLAPMEGDMGGEVGGEPKPPGSICPVDGSEDVDVDNGEFRCNSCGAEGTIHVNLDVNKWPDTIKETGDEEQAGFGIGAEEDQGIPGEELGGEPAAGGEGMGTTMPNVPIGASVYNPTIKVASKIRITPRLLDKVAKQNIQLGSVCPNCGGHNTDKYKSAKVKGDHGICWDCLQEYNYQIKANPKKAHSVFAQFIWTPKVAESCSSCNRLKTSFTKSLNDYGMGTNEFEKLSMKDKGDVILKMSESGTFRIVKEAMTGPLPLAKYAATFNAKFDKFPSASCRERIARRFGENATAMSGPCQGKALSDCVCSQLEGLGIYTDGLAAKVAHVQNSDDPMIHSPSETCVQMLVRDNYKVKDACTICDGLRASAATDEELVIEAIAQITPSVKPMRSAPRPMKPMPSQEAPGGMSPMLNKKPMEGNPMEMSPMPMKASPMEEPGMESMMGNSEMGSAPMESPMEEMMEGEDHSMTDPLDEVIVDDHENGDNGMEIEMEMEGDFDDSGLDGGFDEEGFGEEMGESQDPVTVIVNGLQDILDALKGNLGEEMIDTTGDEFGDMHDDMHGDMDDTLDVGDVTEDTVDNHDEEFNEDLNEESTDIPGVMNDEEESDEPFEKSGEPDEFMEDKPMEDTATKPMMSPHRMDTRQMAAETHENSLPKQASTKDLDNLLYKMKTGTISKADTALDSLIDTLSKTEMFKEAKTSNGVKTLKRTTASESKIKENPAQKSTEVKYTDGGKIGHEESFSADSPDVPRGDATIGTEGPEAKISDTDRPTVPHGAPAMKGEEHYKAEKGNEVDGNQGGGKTTSAKSKKNVKVAMKPCKQCKKPMEDCKCEDDNEKTAQCNCPPSCQCGGKGDCDGSCKCKTAKNTKVKKESQTVSPKSVEKLEDDPDINPSSGPGAGKTHADETHSLGVDEKKPSEGMNEPDVPEAPDGGQLKREHTYDNKLEGPSIPAGGGKNPDYDQNEKNTPEKLDQTLGKENDIAAMASSNEELKTRAIKIAGQMLKAKKITIDELPDKIAELSNATTQILNDYENMMKEASTTKGLQKAAQTGSTETSFQLTSNPKAEEAKEVGLKDQIQSLFKLDARNRDYNNTTGRNSLWH